MAASTDRSPTRGLPPGAIVHQQNPKPPTTNESVSHGGFKGGGGRRSKKTPAGSDDNNNNDADNSRSAHAQEILDAAQAYQDGDNPNANSRHGVGFSGQQSQVTRHNRSQAIRRKNKEIEQAVTIAEHRDIEQRNDAIHDNIPYQNNYGQPRLNPNDKTKVIWEDVPVYPVAAGIVNKSAIHNLITIGRDNNINQAPLPPLPLDPKFRQPVTQQQQQQQQQPIKEPTRKLTTSSAPAFYDRPDSNPAEPELTFVEVQGPGRPVEFQGPQQPSYTYHGGLTTGLKPEEKQSLLDKAAWHPTEPGGPSAQYVAGLADHARELYLTGKSLVDLVSGKEPEPLKPDDAYRPILEGVFINDLVQRAISPFTGKPVPDFESADRAEQLLQSREGQAYLTGSVFGSVVVNSLGAGAVKGAVKAVSNAMTSKTLKEADDIARKLAAPKNDEHLEYAIVRSGVDEAGAKNIRAINNPPAPAGTESAGRRSAIISVGDELTPEGSTYSILYRSGMKSSSDIFQAEDGRLVKNKSFQIHGEQAQEHVGLELGKKISDNVTEYPGVKPNLAIIEKNKELAPAGGITKIGSEALKKDPVQQLSDIYHADTLGDTGILVTKHEKFTKGYVPGAAAAEKSIRPGWEKTLGSGTKKQGPTPADMEVPGAGGGAALEAPGKTAVPTARELAQNVAKGEGGITDKQLDGTAAAAGGTAGAVSTPATMPAANTTYHSGYTAGAFAEIKSKMQQVPRLNTNVGTRSITGQTPALDSGNDIGVKTIQTPGIDTIIKPISITGVKPKTDIDHVPIFKPLFVPGQGVGVIPTQGIVPIQGLRDDVVFKQIYEQKLLLDVPPPPPPPGKTIILKPLLAWPNFSEPKKGKRDEEPLLKFKPSPFLGNVPQTTIFGIFNRQEITRNPKQIKKLESADRKKIKDVFGF